jgi:hypothetical protein
MQRLLHEPTVRLKGVDGEAGGHGRQQLLRELFGIEEGAARTVGTAGADAPPADVRPLKRRA